MNDSKPSRSAFFYILMDITITKELKDDLIPRNSRIIGLGRGPRKTPFKYTSFKKHC